MALGFHDFTAADILTASNMDGIVRQTIMTFASTAARDTALSGNLEEGMHAYNTDDDELYFYSGAAWFPVYTQWASYTPAWTNLTIGSATQVARLRYVGGDLRVRGQVTFAGDTTVGGTIAQTIPLSETADASWQGGTGLANDTGTRIYPLTIGVNPSATSWNWVHAESGNGGLVGTTTPHTWANTDVLTWDITIGVA